METPKSIAPPSYQEFRPDGKLKQFVECIWYMSGQNNELNSYTETLVPGVRCEFVFINSAILWHGNNLQNRPEKISSSFLLGQRDCVNYITCLNRYSTFCVRLKYGCLSAFNKTSVKNFTNKIIPLSKLFGPAINEFTKTIFGTDSFKDKVHLIGFWLENNVADLSQEWFDLHEVLSKITLSPDIDNSILRSLVKNYGWSDKKTERIFLKHTGFTPHQFLKLVRFRKSVEMIFSDYSNLTTIAYKNGFYDQSHLIKEFYRYAGDKPTKFLKNPNNIARFIYGKK